MHALRTDMYLCLICLPYADAWHMQFFYILHVCLVGSRVWGWTLPMCVYLVRSLVCMPYMYALYVCLICMQRNCGSGRCRTLRSSCGKKNTRKRARPRLPVVFICLSLYACPHMLVLIFLSSYACPYMLVLIYLSLTWDKTCRCFISVFYGRRWTIMIHDKHKHARAAASTLPVVLICLPYKGMRVL